MALKIHPGIGVARAGDSPDSFVGPETVDIPGPPAGGYRDGEGRIRRQAARFRLFDDDTAITTAPGNTITWTVHFQGGVASIAGVDQTAQITVGAAVVAELRTDGEGNLEVLSRPIDDAHDGCGDGPVEATLTVGITSMSATSAWVTIVPPDFAPGRLPALAYHLLILDYHVSQGLALPAATDMLSFRRDIYPAIRGRTTLSPAALLALPDEMARQMAAPFNMFSPGISEGPYTHAVVEHFHNGTFMNDWATLTPLTPGELDRGPLSFVDGSCGDGGWEMRLLPIAPGPNPFASGETLRFAPGTAAGVTQPFFGWEGDLPACSGEWITLTDAPLGFGADWHLRGFMVGAPGSLSYQDWVSRAQLLTAQLDFGPVQRGAGVARYVEIEAAGFYVAAPILFTAPLPAGVSVPALATSTGTVPEAGATLQLPVVFQAALAAPLGPIPPASLQLTIDGQPHSIPVLAEIIDAETTQLGLVLDCSASMDEDRGDGTSKFVGLKEAVETIVDVARPNDGIAVAPFSDDALPTLTARSLGDGSPSDTRRQAVRDFVNGLATVNGTSIGDGLNSARNVMTMTPDSFDHDVLVVITDGHENEPATIDSASSSIDQHTFAIGIGTASDVDTDKLRLLTAHHLGYLVLTGETLAGPNQYALDKYLLQILAGANNEHVVLDPIGTVVPGVTARIPILVTEVDFRLDAVVVSNDARELLLALEGPDGVVRPFEALAGQPGVQIVRRRRLGLARVPVPLNMLDGHSWGPGTWHLLIAVRSPDIPGLSPEQLATHFSRANIAGKGGKPISYAAVVNARSALGLSAYAAPPSAVNQRLTIEATVGWAGVPLRVPPAVVAHVVTPAGASIELPLAAAQPGRYLGQLEAVQPGAYPTRIRARGFSPAGHRFLRELTLTPALVTDRGCSEPCGGQDDLASKLRECGAELKRRLDCLLKGHRRDR
jgi:hypothetical protein